MRVLFRLTVLFKWKAENFALEMNQEVDFPYPPRIGDEFDLSPPGEAYTDFVVKYSIWRGTLRDGRQEVSLNWGDSPDDFYQHPADELEGATQLSWVVDQYAFMGFDRVAREENEESADATVALAEIIDHYKLSHHVGSRSC